MNITAEEKQEIQHLRGIHQQVCEQLKKRIVGLEEAIEQILIAIFSGSHALVVGVPGLAKTLLIRSISELLDLKFSRIQFTPDLMPSDITGTEILVEDATDNSRKFSFLQGPIFTNILLADEINRTPPKTQSALLEAMEEHTVSSIGTRFELEPPFFVLATQNPVEQEGTYPLPISQLDRFMFNILFDYPTKEEEYRILRLTVSNKSSEFTPLISQETILKSLKLVRKIDTPQSLIDYTIKLCRNTRPDVSDIQYAIDNIAWGVSPRATQAVIIGAKARAMLQGRFTVTAKDIREIIQPALRHRIVLNYTAEAEGITPDQIIEEVVDNTPAPDGYKKRKQKNSYSQKLYIAMAGQR
ncbi:AAA family ATPase [Candidatus Uabimicrobium sp. HlEnr_7]|uniref:AAA family ATPase n=1 Tax=Candidatus Uabimicrobium helgolandensis TaxID=3095367 RepID=UPI0035578C71